MNIKMTIAATILSIVGAILSIAVLVFLFSPAGCVQPVKPELGNPMEPKPTVVYMDPIGYCFPHARIALNLLREHESLNGKAMTGDGGKARGWLHQHEDHWKEGCEYVGVDWPWPGDTNDLDKCEHVAVGYWMRHARKYIMDPNIENIAELIRRFRKPYDPYCDDNDRYLEEVLR